MDITVLTSVTGDYDPLNVTQGKANFVCYTNCYSDSPYWEVRPSYNFFRDERLNSRIHKILAHKYIDSEYIIWIDGSLRMKAKPEEFVSLLEGKDIAVFKHPEQIIKPYTLGDEFDCIERRNLSDKKLLHEQRTAYKDLPSLVQVYYGGIFVRRNTKEANKLFEEWWAEYCRYPTRDQLSLFKVFHGKVQVIDKPYDEYVTFVGHK